MIVDTYPREEDEQCQGEMRSKNDGKVNCRIPDDRPYNTRKPEPLPWGRRPGFVCGCDDGDESTGVEGQR